MRPWIQDLRLSIRMLARQPALVTAAVLSLAVGMGVNTAVFSALNMLLFRPLPLRDLDRTAYVYHADKAHPDRGTSFPAFQHYKTRTDVFAAAMAFTGPRPVLFADADRRDEIYAEPVTADFFTIANVRLQLGRPFEPDSDRTSDPPYAAVLSDRLWTRRFNADPAIVGKTMVLNDRGFTIRGVAAAGFTGMSPEAVSDLWIPLTAWAELVGEPGRLTGDEHWLQTVGLLQNGVSLQQAAAAMAIAGQSLSPPAGQETKVRSARDSSPASSDDVVAIVGAALAVGLLVLALACMNVTNLLLARAASRQWETAVRMALGASRWQLVRAWVVETALLAAIAGVFGLLLAAWLLDLVVAFKPPALIGDAAPPTLPLSFELNLQVFAFAFGLCALTALSVGLVSGLQASRSPAPARVKADRRFAPGFNIRSSVIASQMALSLVLLVPCGLFVRSALNAAVIDPGFVPEGVLILPISREQAGVRVQKPVGFEGELVRRVAAIPGVEAATAMDPVPLFFGGNTASYSIVGREERVRAGFSRIAPGYFDTLRMRLLAGRDFTAADSSSAPRVAIVNETMAKRYWPEGNAVGARITRGDAVIEVVGVAKDAKYRSLSGSAEPWLYQPLAQDPTENPSLSLAVRAAGDPMALRDAIQREVRALVPSWPVFRFRTLDEGLALQRQLPRFAATLLGLLGSIGILMAAIGLYGVMTYVVKQRTHEIGVRLALGSPAGRVVGLVIGQGMTVCVTGGAIGLVAALGISQFLTSVLFDVSAADPLTFALVPALLAGVGLVACYVPARHAARVSPLEALRGE